MNIDLLNPAHLFLLSLAFFLWTGITIHVTEKQNAGEDTWLEFPAVIFVVANALVMLGSLIWIIIKSL